MIPQTKTCKNPSQVEMVNEIKEKLHDETGNDRIDTDSSDGKPIFWRLRILTFGKPSSRNHANTYGWQNNSRFSGYNS